MQDVDEAEPTMTYRALDGFPHTMSFTSRVASAAGQIRKRLGGMFMVAVVLPTALACVWYGVVASDVYISESKFVVRSPQRATPGGLGALLQGTVFSRSQDDTYSVHEYVRSRDALQELEKTLQIRAAFSRESVDPISRFPGITWWDSSFEALYRHYLRHVAVEYDTTSSITQLRIRAYTPEDAQKVNEALLQMGERLVNNLNIRSRQDLIAVAEREVRQAEERARAAGRELAGFRNERKVYDPDRQSTIQLQAIAKLQDELLATEAQLNQVRQVSPSNPQVASLVTRVEVLRRNIAEETAKVVGSTPQAMSGKAPNFDRLVLERAFAERQLASALSALDTARSEAARKQLYLERLVSPNLPDYPLEPRRLRGVLVVFVIGLLAWGVLSLLIASVREHAE
jgi:capsular polysaccharide transport system permease protein